MSARVAFASATRWLTVFMNSAACWEFSAFLRVMEDISSLEAEVSSRDAACSEAPWAKDWLAPETSPEALETCSAPSASSVTACVRTLLMPRTMKKASSPPAATEKPSIVSVQNLDAAAASPAANPNTSPFVALKSTRSSNALLVATAAGRASAIHRAAASFCFDSRLSG